MSQPSARDEAILTHTNLLSLHLAPVDAAAVASPSVVALQKQIAAYLPTREWFRIPMQFDPTASFISHFSLQHGVSLPQLSVRVLPHHVICDERRARELDASLQWLMESIGVGSSYPVLGVDCESDCRIESDGEVRLLQLSTGTRCLLIRVPEQAALREVVSHAALEKQFGAATGTAAVTPSAANGGATVSSNPLFTPFFHSLLSNSSIFKSGAELWTDALDLWACTGTGTPAAAIGHGASAATGAEMNSCLNMSWIYRNDHGGALSLAAMVNLSLGSDRCFLKDKVTTTSDWGAKELNLRQMIYAALDAQASFVAGANQQQIPRPFSISDFSGSWLAVAANWKQILRAAKMMRDARPGGRYDPQADALTDAAYRLLAQSLQGEEPFHPFVSALLQISFPSPAAAQQSMPPPNAHLIAQGATRTLPLSPTYFQGEDLAIETSNVNWWFATSVEPASGIQQANGDLSDMLDRSRVSVVSGPAGAGKSVAAALEALRSLQRASSVPLDLCPLDMRASAQRVLLLTETEYAARAAAESLSKLVSPADCMLLLSPSFMQSWESSGDDSEGGARIQAMLPTSDEEDRPILICAIDYALGISAGTGDASSGQWRLHHRQTLLVDDASQVWLLKLVLLLRRLPHTERLILFGDEKAYAARWGECVVDDAFGAALHASRSASARAPQPFRVQRHRLTTQWRMSPHITAAVSEAFYQGKLPVGNGERTRGVGWVDVRGEDAAAQAVATIWSHYLRRGLRTDQMAILVLSENARLSLASSHPTLLSRVFTPESFQGRGAEVVFLVLNGSADRRRLLVACTRAASKLFLLGDRAALTSPTSTTSDAIQSLCEFESRELEDVFPDLSAAPAAARSPSPEETFPVLNTTVKSPDAPLATVAAPATQQQWGPGTLSFAKQASPAPSPEKKATPTESPAPDARKKSSEKKPAVTATAAPASAAASLPPIEFQSAPDNRAWKVLPCDKLHSVDGRRPSGVCHLGDKCGFMHADFWIRRGGPGSTPGEFVLFTPGSRIALVEVVEPWNDRRMRQMEAIVDSKLNRANKDKATKEFAHLFPEEATPTKEEEAAAAAAAAAAQAAATAAKTAKSQSAAAASKSVTSSAPSSSLSLDAPSPVDESVGRRSKRGGGRKKIPAKDDFAESLVEAADDFVPVSRRHASKHPSSLAASLAAEFRASEAAAAEAASVAAAEAEAIAQAEAEAAEAAAAAARSSESGVASDENDDGSAGYDDEDPKSSPKKRSAAEPEPAVEYADDMVAGTWWLPEELAALSKNARKKLLWLCPACRAPNANGDARCSLCSGSKPAAAVIRYAKPPGSLGPLPREVEGKYAYESEWVKLVSPPSGGAPHFVAAKAIPAGTVVLREDALYSEVAGGTKAALVPQPRACAQLAAQLLADPVQMALIRARWASSPWSDGQLKLFLRNAESASGVPSLKPKDPNQLKEWGMAMAMAATAKYAREDQEGHAMEVRHRNDTGRQRHDMEGPSSDHSFFFSSSFPLSSLSVQVPPLQAPAPVCRAGPVLLGQHRRGVPPHGPDADGGSDGDSLRHRHPGRCGPHERIRPGAAEPAG